jgi:hypothetical protein
MRKLIVRSFALSAALLLAATAALAADHQARQSRPIQLGTSGGNVNDASHAFCCSGTLGSLVTDGTNQYILSNNHVLARVNQGVAGEAVDQPGLVDVSCQNIAADYVANLTRFIPVNFARGSTNTVDCAIAKVIAGDVDPNGGILDIGDISKTINANPAVGLAVKKSGRTTALTTGSVTGVNGTFSVQYQAGCGSGKKETATFVNQVVFDNISGGGDSGSLIVENTATCPHPVALLFAGSSSTTIGNPIGAVLSALGVSFVGGTCPASIGSSTSGASDFALQHAIDVQQRANAQLLQISGVVGTAVGMNASGRPVVQVYIETDNPGVRGQIPAFVEDLDTRVIVSGTIEAF